MPGCRYIIYVSAADLSIKVVRKKRIYHNQFLNIDIYLKFLDCKVSDWWTEGCYGNSVFCDRFSREFGFICGFSGVVQHLTKCVNIPVLRGQACPYHIIRTSHALHCV